LFGALTVSRLSTRDDDAYNSLATIPFSTVTFSHENGNSAHRPENDLLSGRVQFMFATIPSVIAHIRADKLRAIAVTSPTRSRSMPDVPTVAESGYPGFAAGSWFGFFAPKGTAEIVIAQINKAVNDAIAVPAISQQLVQEGADPVGGTPAQFRDFVQREYEKWRTVVRASGATVE